MEARLTAGFHAKFGEVSGNTQGSMIDRTSHAPSLATRSMPPQQNAAGRDMILEQNPDRAIYPTRR
jgi:hypothetical protein